MTRLTRVRSSVIMLIAMTALADAQRAPATVTVTSTAFTANQPIPAKYSGDGRDVSPPLTWTRAPAATRELALICDDPDAPMPVPFVHWVIYKIPAATMALPEGVPQGSTVSGIPALAGALQGITGFGAAGYNGPAPPPGSPHHYHFTVYALDAPLAVRAGLDKNALLDAMKGHIIGQGELIGTYQR
jgi:Raf kinase inhibitor-like YbhB/YbcL family protein